MDGEGLYWRQLGFIRQLHGDLLADRAIFR